MATETLQVESKDLEMRRLLGWPSVITRILIIGGKRDKVKNRRCDHEIGIGVLCSGDGGRDHKQGALAASRSGKG